MNTDLWCHVFKWCLLSEESTKTYACLALVCRAWNEALIRNEKLVWAPLVMKRLSAYEQWVRDLFFVYTPPETTLQMRYGWINHAIEYVDQKWVVLNSHCGHLGGREFGKNSRCPFDGNEENHDHVFFFHDNLVDGEKKGLQITYCTKRKAVMHYHCLYDWEYHRTVFLPTRLVNLPFDDKPECLWTGDVYSLYDPQKNSLNFVNYGKGTVSHVLGLEPPQKMQRGCISRPY